MMIKRSEKMPKIDEAMPINIHDDPHFWDRDGYDPGLLIEMNKEQYIEMNNRIMWEDNDTREEILAEYGIPPIGNIYVVEQESDKIGAKERWNWLVTQSTKRGAIRLLQALNGDVKRFLEIMTNKKLEFTFDYDPDFKRYTAQSNLSDLRIQHFTKPQCIDAYFDALIGEIEDAS